jgi:nucleotide-binding universal stress UspA family protein
MKIVLAVDESECSQAAVRAVVRQFNASTTDVCVCHSVEWLKNLPMPLAFAEGPNATAGLLARRDRMQQEAEALVARVVDQLQTAGFRTSTFTREGDPRNVILDCAADCGAELIVLGSHGRRGLDRFLLGTVSEAVVRHAPCSVQIVRR